VPTRPGSLIVHPDGRSRAAPRTTHREPVRATTNGTAAASTVRITAPERAICARVSESLASWPLPDDSVLAAWAYALNDGGYWAYVLDAGWRFVFVTDELLVTFRDMGRSAAPVGSHYYSAEAIRSRYAMYRDRSAATQQVRAGFLNLGRYMLASTPGGREELRRAVDPALADLVDELQPETTPVTWIF